MDRFSKEFRDQTLNNFVQPLFEGHNDKVKTLLSDNRREYCGREDQHPLELSLHLKEVEHRTTNFLMSQGDESVERMPRTLLDEHFRVAGRTTFTGLSIE
jgi:hypothetical protein